MSTKAVLIEFIRGIAYCPCCARMDECEPDCTIREDSEALGGEAWYRYERMVEARAVLRGE